MKSGAYDQASDLVNRALDRLPNETTLHRLKAEVDAEACNFETRRFVDTAITQAQELFARSPLEALTVLQRALEQMPGEKRRISYEQTLRQEMESQRSKDLHDNTVQRARQLMDSKEFDKAIAVLESFALEFGQQADIEQLLAFARGELATLKRTEIVEGSLSEARSLIRDGRLEDAGKLVESALQQADDPALSALLVQIREQQAAFIRKLEVLQKRVDLLREHGDLEGALKLLQEQLDAIHGNSILQQLGTSLRAEREQKQIRANAIRSAEEAATKNNFYPTKSTVYQLTANGSLLTEQSVDVREPSKPQPAAPAQVAQAPQQPSGPDRATLEKALGAYEGVFQRAGGKSGKDCQAGFTGVYGGKLRDLSQWCSLAKSFAVAEQCGQAGGSPEAPSLTCSEVITVKPKDGDTQQMRAQKTFRFAKASDGNWQVAGW